MHGKPPRSAPGPGVEHLAVLVVEAADVWLHADLAVGVRQQALDGDEHLGDRQAWNVWFMTYESPLNMIKLFIGYCDNCKQMVF